LRARVRELALLLPHVPIEVDLSAVVGRLELLREARKRLAVKTVV